LPQAVGGPQVRPPLIVIAINEERELPAAFLRRCIVLTQQPDPARTYRDWLLACGRAHFAARPEHARPQLLDETVLTLVADQLMRDREALSAAALPPPGLAEYLDLRYARGYAQLLAEVRRRHERGSLRTCLVEGRPAVHLTVNDGRQRRRPLRQMPTAPAAAPVLILGDLGLLAPGSAAAGDNWHAYLRRLGRAGARALAWLSASPRLLPAPLQRAAQVHCLDGRVPRDPLAAQGVPATVSRDHLAAPLHALLTRLAHKR